MRTKRHKCNDRRVRKKFCLLPFKTAEETIWLETIYFEEIYVGDYWYFFGEITKEEYEKELDHESS